MAIPKGSDNQLTKDPKTTEDNGRDIKSFRQQNGQEVGERRTVEARAKGHKGRSATGSGGPNIRTCGGIRSILLAEGVLMRSAVFTTSGS